MNLRSWLTLSPFYVRWVKLMCAEFVDSVSEDKRPAVFKEICDAVDPVITCEEDGSKW